MCLNCGCGEPDLRHKPSDIVREDVERAAAGQQMSVEDTVVNLKASLEEVRGGAVGTQPPTSE